MRWCSPPRGAGRGYQQGLFDRGCTNNPRTFTQVCNNPESGPTGQSGDKFVDILNVPLAGVARQEAVGQRWQLGAVRDGHLRSGRGGVLRFLGARQI